ncbi:hypothetical protein [Actinosynnema sp. ALI-1.44]|nr:hypothetical protein [Actinosynnema sp. ALI-1.44]
MADDHRRDYGPAGCAENCATRGATLLFVAVVVCLIRKRGGQ